jgi:hypothetical protein
MRRTKLLFRFIFIVLLGAWLATMLSTASKAPAILPFKPRLALVSQPSPFNAPGCNGETALKEGFLRRGLRTRRALPKLELFTPTPKSNLGSCQSENPKILSEYGNKIAGLTAVLIAWLQATHLMVENLG